MKTKVMWSFNVIYEYFSPKFGFLSCWSLLCSIRLYRWKIWTLSKVQKKKINTAHLQCLYRVLIFRWQQKTKRSIGLTVMYATSAGIACLVTFEEWATSAYQKSYSTANLQAANVISIDRDYFTKIYAY